MKSCCTSCTSGHTEKSDELKQLVAVYIQDMVQKSEPKSYTKLNRMMTRHLEQKTREKQVSTRDRRLADKPTTGERNMRLHSCRSMHGLLEKGKGGTKGQRSPPPSRRKSNDTDDIKRRCSDSDGKQTGTGPSEASRIVSHFNGESVTQIRHVFTGIFLNASTRIACSFIPKGKSRR